MGIKKVFIPVVTFVEVPLQDVEYEIENKQEAYDVAVNKIWEYGVNKFLTEEYFICTRVETNETDNIKDNLITDHYTVEFFVED